MSDAKKPAARKRAAKRPASPTPGEAARHEGSGDEKLVVFGGETLVLPDHLPATTLFDIHGLSSGDDVMPFFRLLESLLGADQFVLVRNLIADDPDINTVDDSITAAYKLLSDIVVQYGLTLGK